jgi:hypothetical protein
LLQLDGGVLLGGAHDALGDVSLGQATAGGAILFTSPRSAPVSARLGPRLELGGAWAGGNPATSSTSSYAGAGFVSAASLLGAFQYRVAGVWRISLELEAGAMIVSLDARADQRRVAGLDGPFFGVTLGLSRGL